MIDANKKPFHYLPHEVIAIFVLIFGGGHDYLHPEETRHLNKSKGVITIINKLFNVAFTV